MGIRFPLQSLIRNAPCLFSTGDQLIQYQGCFRDNTEDNKVSTVLSQQRLFDQSTNMKVQDCTAACQSYGFAGLRVSDF